MKWIILISSVLVITGCGTAEIIDYREVDTPVYTSFPHSQQLDVTKTTVDYY